MFPGMCVISIAASSGLSSSLPTIMFIVSVGIDADAVIAALSSTSSSLPCSFFSHAVLYSGVSTAKVLSSTISFSCSGTKFLTTVPFFSTSARRLFLASIFLLISSASEFSALTSSVNASRSFSAVSSSRSALISAFLVSISCNLSMFKPPT